jgi:hypothetical protein
MVLAAHMTELEAVNEMLLSINESPVQALDGSLQDASIGQTILKNESRRIQAQGWHCNTRRNIELSKNVGDQFAVGIDTLKIDTVNPRSRRANHTPAPSRFINVSLRKSADGTKYLLYDVDNDTETWPSETTVTVDIVSFVEFDHLTPMLQIYVFKSAAHRFQKAMVGSRILFEFTKEDVLEAMTDAVQEDADNEDNNMLTDNRSSMQITYRRNPLYGY